MSRWCSSSAESILKVDSIELRRLGTRWTTEICMMDKKTLNNCSLSELVLRVMQGVRR